MPQNSQHFNSKQFSVTHRIDRNWSASHRTMIYHHHHHPPHHNHIWLRVNSASNHIWAQCLDKLYYQSGWRHRQYSTVDPWRQSTAMKRLLDADVTMLSIMTCKTYHHIYTIYRQSFYVKASRGKPAVAEKDRKRRQFVVCESLSHEKPTHDGPCYLEPLIIEL